MTRQPRTLFVDLAAQRAALGSSLEEAWLEALRRGDYILGQDVGLLEAEFAAYCGVRHAIGVDSGTSALELAVRAHGIGPGDEVITVANTFIATAFAISHAGATPVFVDADPVTYNIDVSRVERAIGSRTQAIMPVHLYGQPVDMTAVNALAEAYGLAVIEDACQAHGARDAGRRVGSLGSAAAFSFYPAKNLGAHGDGGMVVTDNDELAACVRLLRNYGAVENYKAVRVGHNRRLDTLQAAMLRVKLPWLDSWNSMRRAHARLYDDVLRGVPVVRPTIRDGVEHVWHLYVVRVSERDRVRAQLRVHGIDTGIHYPIPVHAQPAYRHLGYGAGSFPVAERYADQVLSLPMYPELPGEAVARVGQALASVASGLRTPEVDLR